MARSMTQTEVVIASHGKLIEGDLSIPADARGLVIFAHGSGSSRFSPRNRFVAGVLQKAGLATLLLDLLTIEEEESERWTRHLRFDIELLSGRLVSARQWAATQSDLVRLPVGYFGSSTGAAAALVAASRESREVHAIVSRGGRPDLAGDALPYVRVPTLLIVGGNDEAVIELNEQAMRQMTCEMELRIVPGATHLFEESGTLDEVARMAAEWFRDKLGAVQEAELHP
ncbi:MAG: dienelactone hydrolase family protein [Myxococcaceae bacterium]